MSGKKIELCSKALLLFLQSLNIGSYFQLIGFGSSFEYYCKEPLEYNKENDTNLIKLIKDLKGNKGGTNIYDPLESIFKNQIYEKIDIPIHIFVLTDGIIKNKEKTLNLIGSYSDKFTLHSLGIGHDYDKDLVKRSAILGNGNYYFIENLEDINLNVIKALENSLITKKIKCN